MTIMKEKKTKFQRVFSLVFVLLLAKHSMSQGNILYENLPVGKYAVGFKIFTLTDETRIVKPEYNYLGEKTTGDRRKKITVHLWYPAFPVKNRLRYEDYCYNSLLKTTNEIILAPQKDQQVNGKRRSVEGWFGKPADEAWKKLLETPMLSYADATPRKEKFPVLIGMLRPLSTAITNEVLASNGYVVAMIAQENFSSFALATIDAIPDMRFTINYLGKLGSIDPDRVGTFGFSGSGFSQVLFAMNDYKIKAVADIESGIYMDNLFQNFSNSNYYMPAKMRVPFLHIFSRDLSKQEKFIDEFENKTKFAKRYRLLLNQPALHHWDFASEGYTASILLNNRGEQKENIRQSFEIATYYLVNFFDAVLKGDRQADAFLSTKPSLPHRSPMLWDISILNAAKPAPDRTEFEYIVRNKGIDQAITIVKNTIKGDTLTNLMQWFNLNGLGYTFLNEKKYKEAIAIFKLNTELHPTDPNLFDSLAEGYESSGDPEKSKAMSGIVMELLNKKTSLTDAEKGLKANAQKRM
jgi:hypothetical protein